MKNYLKLTFVAMLCALAFTACKKTAGTKAETGAAAGTKATAPSSATLFKVNPATSQIIWTGHKPTGQHTGTIKIAEGQVGMDGQKVVSGEFVMDMNSISVSDLKAGEGKEDLEAHLKGTVSEKANDFFNVSQYPTAKFVITSTGPNTTGSTDMNATITGDLTLKGVTRSITFPAFVGAAGNDLAASANFKINRTEWGINFQSKSVFTELKEKFINDEINLVLDLKGNK